MDTSFEVEGDNLKIAGRNFYEINQFGPGRLLTRDERREINGRVQTLSEKYGDPPWDIWRAIHRAIGVEGIDQLRIEHRDQVQFILDLLEERYGLQSRLDGVAIHESKPSDQLSTLERKIARGGIISWVTEFPEYAGLLFMMGITFGVALGMI